LQLQTTLKIQEAIINNIQWVQAIQISKAVMKAMGDRLPSTSKGKEFQIRKVEIDAVLTSYPMVDLLQV